MNNQEEMPENIDLELRREYWHTEFWRLDMDGPCEQDIEIENLLIYERPSSNTPFSICFSDQLSEEEFKKHLRAVLSKVEKGGLGAIIGKS